MMDRRLFGFIAVVALLIVCNTVFADDREMESRRIQSHAHAYVGHHHVEKHHGHWRYVADFRTRRHNISHPIVGIDRRISAIQLQGLKRTSYVRHAFVETAFGRVIHVPELEGRLFAGYTKTVRLHRELYVRNLVLEVDSPYHKRSYIRVIVRSPVDNVHAYRRYTYRH